MTMSHPWAKNSQPAELTKENKVDAQPGNKEQSVSNKNLSNSGTDKISDVNNVDIDNRNTTNVIQQTKQLNNNSTSNKFSAVKTVGNAKGNDQLTDNNKSDLLANNDNQDRSSVVGQTGKENNQTLSSDEAKNSSQANLSLVAPTNNNKTDQQVVSSEQKTKSDQQPSATTTDAKKSKTQKTLSKRNGFGFFASAGPDVSKAADSKMGKTTLVYGAGVSYTKDHITLRTGIFASKKIYWAGPNDYKLSFTPPPPTKFEGADANCDVIEIPVKLNYNFAINEKSNWFASTGLSTYLMKEEKYTYTYKTSSGAYYYYPYVAKNENKHYFSILTLSGGYTHKISNTVSLSAEPYIEVPLTGIGVGKVHLSSGGILFSIGVNPFKK